MANGTVGAPRKYEDPEEFQKLVDEYFEVVCKDEVIADTYGKPVLDNKGRIAIRYNPPTMAGLTLHLGFASRQSLYEYLKLPEFGDTVSRAQLKMEAYAEKQLFVGNVQGAQFWLKNRGDNWRDKTESDVSFKPYTPEPVIKEI